MTNPAELDALVLRARALDRDALTALVEAYSTRLFGFLFRLTGHRHEAEDLVQEVFVRVVAQIREYREEGKFEAWLFRIAANLARDRARKIRRRPDHFSLEARDGQAGHGHDAGPLTGFGSSAPPAGRAELNEAVDRMQSALAELPDAEREVILLRHYSGLSFAEIAEVMGTPLGTALARAHRGLRKLRERMDTEP